MIGSIKGKSAIAVARQCGGRQRNFNGERFWARGYAVSTVGFEEAQMRASLKQQEHSTPKDRMKQASFKNVIDDPGSPKGCSQPSSPPLCGGVMTIQRTLETFLLRFLNYFGGDRQ